MEDDPKKLAFMLAGKGEKKAEPTEEEGESEGPGGAEAFASAVKLAMKGDSAAAFDALKLAVSACQGEDY